VRKVDTANQKITLRHGPLSNLGMPAMTMVFSVQDAAQLEGLKVGDKVSFLRSRRAVSLSRASYSLCSKR
jgi:Cu/Ag efflux protein CusF